MSPFVFNPVTDLAVCLQKTGGFALWWPLAHAKLAYGWLPAIKDFSAVIQKA
jgi:hypothetical protein